VLARTTEGVRLREGERDLFAYYAGSIAHLLDGEPGRDHGGAT
jgi:hypothetical protein